MKQVLLILVLLLLLGFTIGCGDDSQGNDSVDSYYSTADIIIENADSFWAIYEAYVSPSSSDSWTENVLPSGVILEPGESYSISVNPGVYDIKIGCGGDSYRYNWGVEISGGSAYTFSWSNPN